ncbi:hypothetical protein H9565_19205 [Zobellia russellii]|nr:hypothetical protein [Zobellia russellii]
MDNLSFKFVNEDNQIETQNIKDFNAENERFFNLEEDLEHLELIETSKWKTEKKSIFKFFSLPSQVLWDEFQTDIRSQSNRNTCSAFAMVAAIEARYKRDYGLDLDLSEQFFWHCYKSTGITFPKKYKYENQSSFWGGGNSQGIKQTVNFSIPLEEHCPYLSGNSMTALKNQIPAAGNLQWKSDPALNTVTQDEVDAFEYSPLYIPHSARQNAKYGVKSYQLFSPNEIRDTSNLEKLLAWGNEVIVDANLKWKTNSNTGVREYDATSSGGYHAFLVVGYDRNQQVFYIKNSWNEPGLIRVSYEFAENCFSHGSIVTSVTDPKKPTLKNRAIGKWNMNHDGWKGSLTIRRFSKENNQITRLGHYKASDGSIKAINGNYIHDGRGIQFYMTNDENTDPTLETGQQFTIDVYSWDVTKAAGNTIWKNTDYGVYLSRTNFNSRYGKDYLPTKWKGTWDMNHDGWKGVLTVSKITSIPLLGWLVHSEYKTSNGATIPVKGLLTKQDSHVLRMNIKFSEANMQPFILHFHTWSSDLASGYTLWNGKRFGAVAVKR